MAELIELPKPHLDARLLGARRVPALVDAGLARATGVRIAFTGREGGVSAPPYDSLNLGSHVKDDPASVQENRSILLEAMDAASARLLVLNQVHGTDGVLADSAEEEAFLAVSRRASEGADFAVVECADVAALLCFADCASLIIASPSGRFAVAHAGWRGALAHIARISVEALALRDAYDLGVDCGRLYNAYIGPHIRSECFECGEDVVEAFSREFGGRAAPDSRHVSLVQAITADLVDAGLDLERICDSGVCTMCHPDRYFSYRASGGTCGRHGAVAVRLAGAVADGVSHLPEDRR